jgi:hypothetical protein
MPRSSDDNHRVVSFRPRRAKVSKTARWREPPHHGDPDILLSLAKFERDDREDDYRHRMIMNGLAFVTLLALIVIGVWLTDNISDQHHTLVRTCCSPRRYFGP